MESRRGQLLLAATNLFDPNFRRTVILVTEHSDDGAMGLVLNRPAELAVQESVPDLLAYADPSEERVFVGGPVSADSVIVLAEFEDPTHSAGIVLDDDIGFVPADAEDHVALAAELRRRRIFAGHSGWGPGQLEAELDERAWIVEPATREDVFGTDPDELWASVLQRKGGEYRLIATMPEDPGAN